MFTYVVTPVLLMPICGFKLLSSIPLFHPEGLPLVFFVGQKCKHINAVSFNL